MIPVSATWSEDIQKIFRAQGYLKVNLEVVPPGLREGAVATTSDSAAQSNIDTIIDGIRTTPKAYVSLESCRWLLNGQFYLQEDSVETDDWWSTMMSAGNKKIEFEFDQTYNIPGLYIQWDLVNGTFPESITVQGYGTDEGLLNTYQVDDISSAVGFIETPFDRVKKVILTINSWNVDTWRCRINEVVFGLLAEYDSINNGRVTQGESYDVAKPLGDELPTHTMTVSLRNIDLEFDPLLATGISKYLARRQLISYQWGFTLTNGTVEWTDPLVYYINAFSVPKDSKDVKIDATSRLEFLTNDFKLDNYTGEPRTLYDIATNILQHSGIIRNTDEEIPWELADKLKQYTSTAYVPNDAANQSLQLIAGSVGCWLKTSPVNGFVQIADLGLETLADGNYTVDISQQLGDPSIDITELLHTISIGVYKYVRSTEKTQISKGDYTIDKQTTLQVDYNVSAALGVTCSVSGGTLVSFTGYGTSATVVIAPSGASSTVTVTLEGYEVRQSVTYVETYRDTSITQGLDIVVDNPFITEINFLDPLTSWLVSWYNKRQEMEMEYLGYPELTSGDLIDLTTVYGESPNTRVLGNKLKFNGAFGGTLEVQ